MPKRISLLLACLALILAACQSTPQSTPPPGEAQETAGASAPASTSPVNTAPSPPETQAPAATVAESQAGPASCTVVSPQPTPGPTEQSLFPPPGEADWILGPDTAAVTITEYSDFQ
jgi:protein-disulfide isomerase